MTKFKSALLRTTAVYAPVDEAAAASEAPPQSAAPSRPPTPKTQSASTPSKRRTRPPARAPPTENDEDDARAARRKKRKERKEQAQQAADAGASSMSIERFCWRNNISDDFYYKLQRQGLGPKTMKVGTRTLISIEAERAWRRKAERDGITLPPEGHTAAV